MVSEINSINYPQMSAEMSSGKFQDMEMQGIDAFIKGEDAVFLRAEKVKCMEQIPHGVHLVLEAVTSLNRTAYTHETSMHQFARTGYDGVKGELHLLVEFWSEHVFRIRCRENGIPREVPDDRMPHMLNGKPQEIFVEIKEEEQYVTVSTEKITIEIGKNPFTMCARDEKGIFWESYRYKLFTADIFDLSVCNHKGRTAYFESFVMGADEEVYGLGERFDHVSRKGIMTDFWNKDAIGSTSRRTYINIPFCHTTAGYGVFVNSDGNINWEIGTLDSGALGFATEDDQLDYFIIHGSNPGEILYRYSLLTGFAKLPPVWTYGLWLSRCSYQNWDEVFEIAEKARVKDIPADVVHLDTAWFSEDWNCDLKFSPVRFAEPEKHIKELRDKGFRTTVWQYNFVPQKENNINLQEGKSKGYFVRNKDGRYYGEANIKKGSWTDDEIIDFSNPEAAKWYAEKIKDVMKQGISAVKVDFGEGIPADGVFMNADGKKFHNRYSLVYSSVISDAAGEITGEHFTWGRSGTAGSQRYPIHWNGDSQCTFTGLQGSVRSVLSTGLSGIPFLSCDIGGFIGTPDAELYIRWAQFGLLISHSRCHGCDTSREPWSFGEKTEEIFRRYDKLRYSLIPYLYTQSMICCDTGKPLVRAMYLDYSEDRNTRYLEDQYMLGENLLVAPVVESMRRSPRRSVYLPRGRWFHYFTKEAIVSDGMWITVAVTLEDIPIYVRDNCMIPYGEERESTNNEIGSITKIETYGNYSGIYDDGTNWFELADNKLVKAKGKIAENIVSFH